MKKFKSILKNKKGNEILQTLVIISVIGALAITVISSFSTEISSSLGFKVKDAEWQSTPNQEMTDMKKDMSNKQTISLK